MFQAYERRIIEHSLSKGLPLSEIAKQLNKTPEEIKLKINELRRKGIINVRAPHRTWTDEDLVLLQMLRDQGKSNAQIAQQLDRSEAAVQVRLSLLKKAHPHFSPKTPPVRKVTEESDKKKYSSSDRITYPVIFENELFRAFSTSESKTKEVLIQSKAREFDFNTMNSREFQIWSNTVIMAEAIVRRSRPTGSLHTSIELSETPQTKTRKFRALVSAR